MQRSKNKQIKVVKIYNICFFTLSLFYNFGFFKRKQLCRILLSEYIGQRKNIKDVHQEKKCHIQTLKLYIRILRFMI